MGKSSSVVIGFRYHVAYLHGLCGHPIDAFTEFRAAGKTAWSGRLTDTGTITINKPGLFGGDKDQGGIVGDVDILFGKTDQLPNSYLLSAFGSQVSGMEGVTTLVFKGGEFGAMNPYPQKPAYKGEAILQGWDGACWYPEKAVVPVAASTTLAPDADGWEYQILPQDADPAHQNLTIPTDGWLVDGQAPFAGGDASGGNTEWPVETTLWVRRTVTVTGPNQTLRVSGDNGFVVFLNGAIASIINPTNENSPGDKSGAIPLAAGATIEIAIKAYDELQPAPPYQGGAILNVEITSPGVNAMNPAHVLYELRTAQDRGQEPTASMADANWRTGADWFYNNVFGLCTDYDPDSESVDDAIARIEKVAGCAVNRDPTDGLWYLDIANGVYDLNSLPILTDDDILDWNDAPKVLDDLVNSVAVEYFDPQQWITVTTRPVTALALISANGLNHQTNEYHELPTADLALRVAQRDLAAMITPASAFGDITTTRKPYSWRRNTYFRIQAPKKGIADLVCLLAEKSDGTLKSGAMTISAAQDIYNLAAASYMDSEPGVDPRPPQIPLGIMQQAAFEAPYFQIVRNLSRADLAALPDDTGYLMTVAKDPATSRDYTVTVSTDGGTTYAGSARGPWCPTALIVEGDTLTDAAPTTSFTLSGGVLLSSVIVGSAGLWDGEIVRVDAVDAAANTISLGRGCADTVPVAHAANARIWFFDGFAGKVATEYTDAETIDVELLTNTGSDQLDPAFATPMSLTFDQRQFRPYPPARLQINDAWYPQAISGTFSASWAHRDRVSQADQLVDTTQADIGPEAGVTYDAFLYDENGVLRRTEAGLVDSPFAWDSEAADSQIPGADARPGTVISLLHFDGANASTIITDQVSGRVWTASGAAKLVTSGAKFGTACASFTPSTSYITSGEAASFWKFLHDGTTSWTIEGWVNPSGSGSRAILDTGGASPTANAGIYLQVNPSNQLDFIIAALNATNAARVTAGNVPNGAWTYIKILIDLGAADGKPVKMFVGGVLVAEGLLNGPAAADPSSTLTFGRYTKGNSLYFSGLLDEFRITKGYADYSPGIPSAPFPDSDAVKYRLNGRVRLRLRSSRDSVTSWQEHDITVRRAGYGFNYGMFYGGAPS